MATANRRIRRLGALVVLLLALSSTTAPGRATANPPPPPRWAATDLASGVQQLLTIRPGLVVHAARVTAGAPVALQPVVAYDRVGGGHAPNHGRQPTSELCSRVGGIVCVNADFFNCPTCGQAAGGLVDKGRPLRSFRHNYPQVSVVDDRLTMDPLTWKGTVRAAAGSTTVELPIASLNRGAAHAGSCRADAAVPSSRPSQTASARAAVGRFRGSVRGRASCAPPAGS